MTALTEPVVGFRTWCPNTPLHLVIPSDVVSGTGLWSSTVRYRWKRGINRARHDRHFGNLLFPPLKCMFGCPQEVCHCGLHALRTYDRNSYWYKEGIRGAVLLWGRLRSGPSCVRAQFAEVIALSDGHEFAPFLAKMYGVPCVPDDALAPYAMEHGKEIPIGLVRV